MPGVYRFLTKYADIAGVHLIVRTLFLIELYSEGKKIPGVCRFLTKYPDIAGVHPIVRTLFSCLVNQIIQDMAVTRGVRDLCRQTCRKINLALPIYPSDVQLLEYLEQFCQLSIRIVNITLDRVYFNYDFNYPEVNILIHQDEYCAIKNWDAFSSIYWCPGCELMLQTHQILWKHEKKCLDYAYFEEYGSRPPKHVRKEHVLKGRWNNRFLNLFDEIKRLTGFSITPEDIQNKYMAVFDTETVLFRKHEEMPSDTDSVRFLQVHRLFMIGVCSNVPGYSEIKLFIKENEEDRDHIQQFLKYLLEMADAAYEHSRWLLKPIYKRLDYLKKAHQKEGNTVYAGWIQALINRLSRRLRTLCVIGYNW